MSHRAAANSSGTGTVSALERGISVLRCFDENVATLSNAELSLLTGIPKPTVTRLAATLVSLGLLRQDLQTERFSLAAGVVSIARAFLAHVDVREVARPHMSHLARELSGATYLAVPDGTDMVLVEIVRSRKAGLRSHHEIGTRIPMATSALGRAYLSAMAKWQPHRYAQVLQQLEQHHGKERWPQILANLKQAQAMWEAEGFVLSLGEVNPQIHSAAVPLPVADGEPLALNFGGPSFTFTEDWMRTQVAPLLQQMADAIAHEIGGR